MKVKSLSCVRLFVTPWTVAYQATLSMGFSMQEYWSGLPFPFPGDLTNLGIEPGSPELQADSLLTEPPRKLQLIAMNKECCCRHSCAFHLVYIRLTLELFIYIHIFYD